MATRTRARSTSTRSNGNNSRDKSAFDWGSTGAIATAAVGGALLAVAANLGRKFAVQGISASKGNWADSLAAEHAAVLALFDKLLETEDDQTTKRTLLLMQIGHALDKHAYAEEHVVYPCLREDNFRAEAELLEKEHGEVKTYLHRLNNMAKDSPEWIGIVQEFRDSLSRHMAMEEEEVFPGLQSELDEATDKRITKEVNKAGFMMA
ncbi:MAG: hemerythrin domain-containing protein [Pseudomonadota bacterium]|nr:hemerythrin domain-containing protein [Pseudomonadota bacterium]